MERDKKILDILNKFQDINVYFRKEIYRIGNSFSFTIPQLKIIALLAENKSLRVSDLSAGSALSESTVSGIVDRLVKQKAVIRKRSSKDRRVVNLYLSDKSRTEYEKFRKLKEDFFIKSFAGIQNSDISIIIDGLTILRESILGKNNENK